MIIAITGLPGAGKSSATKVFIENGFSKIRFGDVTDMVAESRGLKLNEENERGIREELRRKYGMDAYAKLNLLRLETAKGDVVIDGLYSWEECRFLRKIYKKDFRLIAIIASAEIRYERLSKRSIRPLDASDAKKRDETEIKKLNIAKAMKKADHKVMNEGTLEELKGNIDRISADL